MGTPRKHHFVPQWYLKGFCDPDGFLHIYDRRSRKLRRQRPQKVMAINDYYRQEWTAEGIDPFALERFAGSKLEPIGKQAIEKLLSNPIGVTEFDMWWLAIYVAFQRVRVPRQAKSARALVESYTLTQGDRHIASALLRGDITISESVRFEYMKSVLDLMVKNLAGMQWDILSCDEQSSFLTSDSPVTFYNRECPPPTEAGICLAGTKILFPLSSKHLLLLRHPQYRPATDNPLKPIPQLEGPKVDLSITVYPDPVAQELVDTYNSVIYIQSDRLIVGNSDDLLKRCAD